MLPGLITQQAVNLYTFKHVKKNELTALCLNGNEAPVGVGRTHLSGEDMYMSGMRGKCLIMLQIYQDNLWLMGDRNIPLPFIPTVKDDNQSLKETQINPGEENKTENETKPEAYTTELLTEQIENMQLKETANEENKTESSADLAEERVDHEKILTECFLCAVKFKSKEFKLPIIVSTFMKTMQACWFVFKHHLLHETNIILRK